MTQIQRRSISFQFSADGGFLDIQVAAFVSAIHSLLTDSRSHAPICVLIHMKSVVSQTRLFLRVSDRTLISIVLKSTRGWTSSTLEKIVISQQVSLTRCKIMYHTYLRKSTTTSSSQLFCGICTTRPDAGHEVELQCGLSPGTENFTNIGLSGEMMEGGRDDIDRIKIWLLPLTYTSET